MNLKINPNLITHKQSTDEEISFIGSDSTHGSAHCIGSKDSHSLFTLGRD